MAKLKPVSDKEIAEVLDALGKPRETITDLTHRLRNGQGHDFGDVLDRAGDLSYIARDLSDLAAAMLFRYRMDMEAKETRRKIEEFKRKAE